MAKLEFGEELFMMDECIIEEEMELKFRVPDMEEMECAETDEEECKELEYLNKKRESKKKEKKKGKVTYQAVYGEKGIRKKYVDGVFHSYELYIFYGYVEIYDERIGRHVKKKEQEKRTFHNLEEAIKYRNRMQEQKMEARRKKVEMKRHGATVIDAANAYYAYMKSQMEEGKVSPSYLEQLRIQTDHFKKYFNGARTTYVKDVDTLQIEAYFEEEEKNGISRASIEKYKSHLKAIWDYMLKDSIVYGVTNNVVNKAKITAKKKEHKPSILNYLQLQELIEESCKMEDPTFLYIVIFSMTQGLRRGELCGLMWKDIDFESNRVNICHNRIQLVTSDVTKLPKCEKTRVIELHRAGRETLLLYKVWQENILGRAVLPEEYVMQWEINLLQNYVCHTGKVSRRWKEIYASINKRRVKEEKDVLPYGRIHDGRHTYITLSLQGIKKEDGKTILPANYFQVFQSAGHSLPKAMQNVSTTSYNNDVNTRWDVTRFWNDVLEISVADTWEKAQKIRREEYEEMTPFERDKRRVQKERRLEKAKEERLKSNPPADILQEYEPFQL